MREINLTRGLKAIVDDEDFDFLNQFSWSISSGYPAAWISGKVKRMHRVILNLTDPSVKTDHINRNRLDNRRCNLRLATSSQNAWNKSKASVFSSHYKGVYLHSTGRFWIAQISVAGKMKYLGCYRMEAAAAQAYNNAAAVLHGEFGVQNQRPA